jgi:ASC-1-like (ASCH) protein
METSNNKINPNYTEHLSEPWFSLIVLGLKTIEGRKNKDRFKEMKIGDVVEWVNTDFEERKVITRIIGKTEYSTFAEYLENEGLEKCLPGMEKYGLEHGLSVYFKYFTKEDEKTFGVVAVKLELI